MQTQTRRDDGLNGFLKGMADELYNKGFEAWRDNPDRRMEAVEAVVTHTVQKARLPYEGISKILDHYRRELSRASNAVFSFGTAATSGPNSGLEVPRGIINALQKLIPRESEIS